VISIDIAGVCDHLLKRRRPRLSRAVIAEIEAVVVGSLERHNADTKPAGGSIAGNTYVTEAI
jgi:hypothetical protein